MRCLFASTGITEDRERKLTLLPSQHDINNIQTSRQLLWIVYSGLEIFTQLNQRLQLIEESTLQIFLPILFGFTLIIPCSAVFLSHLIISYHILSWHLTFWQRQIFSQETWSSSGAVEDWAASGMKDEVEQHCSPRGIEHHWCTGNCSHPDRRLSSTYGYRSFSDPVTCAAWRVLRWLLSQRGSLQLLPVAFGPILVLHSSSLTQSTRRADIHRLLHLVFKPNAAYSKHVRPAAGSVLFVYTGCFTHSVPVCFEEEHNT